MDDALTRVINEGIEKGRLEGRSEGRIELLVSLCKSGHISVDIAAAEMHISTDEFQKYLENNDANT